MACLFNPLAYPLLLRTPNWVPARTAGDGRLPLSMLVVTLLEPAQVVELGVGEGGTFAALCQAVEELRLPTQCLGVELPHTSSDGIEHLMSSSEFRAKVRAQYGGFSRVLEGDAQAAADHYPDDQLDLLHLGDGLSEAEAESAFQRWLPKLTARGVILVSNIRPNGSAQSLAHFWAQSKRAYPHFELLEGQGMGLLTVGPEPPEDLARLTRLAGAEQVALRELLHRLGQAARMTAPDAPKAAAAEIQTLSVRLAEREAALRASQQEKDALEQTLKGQTELTNMVQARLDLVTAREREFRALYLDLHRQMLHRDAQAGHLPDRDRVIAARDQELSGLRAELARIQSELHTIQAGRVWRCANVYWRARRRLIHPSRRSAQGA